jgi:hypothetical protein
MKRVLILIVLMLLVGCARTAIVTEPVETAPVDETPAAVTEEPAEEAAATCDDSDAGIDTTVDGVVTGVLADGTEYDYRDDCYGGVYIVEYYCEDNTPKSRNIKCENGCKKDICIEVISY